MGVTLRDELQLEKLRQRLIDRPNDINSTVQLGEILHCSSMLSAKLVQNCTD